MLSFFPVGKLQLQCFLLAHSVTAQSQLASDPQSDSSGIGTWAQHRKQTANSRNKAVPGAERVPMARSLQKVPDPTPATQTHCPQEL